MKSEIKRIWKETKAISGPLVVYWCAMWGGIGVFIVGGFAALILTGFAITAVEWIKG